MKKKIILFTLLALTMSTLFTGCTSFTGIEEEETPAEKLSGEVDSKNYVAEDGTTYGEGLIENYIDMDDPNWIDKIKSSDTNYFVKHDNKLYPMWFYWSNFSSDKAETANCDYTREIVNTGDFENQYLPTLYKGDTIICYEPTMQYTYLTFERYKDLGWTLPFTHFDTRADGGLLLIIPKNMKSEEAPYLADAVPDISKIKLAEDEEQIVLYVDKIGGTHIDSEYLTDVGTIDPSILTRLMQYSVEYYRGTEMQTLLVEANYHAYSGFELYQECDITPIDTMIYETAPSDYMVSGYYLLNGVGMFRYVNEEFGEDETPHFVDTYDFNVPLLNPTVRTNVEGNETQIFEPEIYSSIDDLNKYVTEDPSAFGYKDASGELVSEPTDEDIEKSYRQYLLSQNVSTELKLVDRKGFECELEIIPTDQEAGGSITLVGDNGKKINAVFSPFTKTYVATWTGSGTNYKCTIYGLYKDYQINMKNVYTSDKKEEDLLVKEETVETEEE